MERKYKERRNIHCWF